MQARNRDAPTKSAETTATQRPRRAWRWALVGAMAVSAVGVGSAGVALQRYSETDAFCGLACHRAMAPQHIGHRDGTHAHARCVDCHIGQGALAHVVAKLRGADQLWGMVTNDFTRPVRMQHRGDEPMRPRCERCHDLAKLPEVHRIQALRFGYDVANRAQSVSVTLRIGNARGNDDGRRGIGWHMQKPDQVSYVAADEAANEIPWVQVQRADGGVTTYVSRLSRTSPQQLAAMPRRRMDCTDCHNRVGHRLPLPDAAIDAALQNGTLSRAIPSIKRSLVQTLWGLGQARKSDAGVRVEDAIRDSVEKVHRSSPLEDGPLRQASLDQVTSFATQLSAQALHGHLNVGWGAYADRVGHRYSSGCFRCHDGQHVSEDGRVLTHDCASSCHTAPKLTLEATAEGTPVTAPSVAPTWHPYQLPILDLEIEGHDRLLCADCHGLGRAPARACEDCHHPPGI